MTKTCSVCNSEHDFGKLSEVNVCRMCWLAAEHNREGYEAMLDEAKGLLFDLAYAVNDYCAGVLSPSFEAEVLAAREFLKPCPCGKCKDSKVAP